MKTTVTTQYFQQEPSRVGRLFLNFLRIVNPIVAKEAIQTAQYFRTIDNIVDDTTNTDFAEEILTQEEESLQQIFQGGKATTEHSVIINKLAATYGPLIAGYSQTLLEHFKTDLHVKKTHEPLTERQLAQHFINGSLPVFQFLSITAYKQELVFGEKLLDYLHTWMTYDHLCDIYDDVQVNTLHISKENCERFGLYGEPRAFNEEQLQKYVAYKRKEVLKTIHQDANGVLATNLPTYIGLGAKLYLHSRAPRIKQIK